MEMDKLYKLGVGSRVQSDQSDQIRIRRIVKGSRNVGGQRHRDAWQRVSSRPNVTTKLLSWSSGSRFWVKESSGGSSRVDKVK